MQIWTRGQTTRSYKAGEDSETLRISSGLWTQSRRISCQTSRNLSLQGLWTQPWPRVTALLMSMTRARSAGRRSNRFKETSTRLKVSFRTRNFLLGKISVPAWSFGKSLECCYGLCWDWDWLESALGDCAFVADSQFQSPTT